MKKNILLITASFFLAVGCTNKQYERVQHEKVKNSKDSSELKIEKTVISKSLLQANENLILASKGKSVASSKLTSRVILPLVQHLLVSRLDDRVYISSLEGQRVLAQLNQAILLVDSSVNSLSDEEKIQYQKSLKTYKAAVFNGCISGTLKGCKSYHFFRSDYNTSKVVQILVRQLDTAVEQNQKTAKTGYVSCVGKCEEALKEYYRLIFYTYDLRNGVLDKDLEFLYIKRAKVFGDILNQNSRENREELVRHSKVFQLIVDKYDVGETKSNKDFLKFIRFFSPWTYSVKSKDLFKKASQGLFRKAAILYKQDDQLRASLLKSVALSQAGEGSFLHELNTLKTDYPKILKKLNLKVDAFTEEKIKNEYFFLVDSLYRGDHSFSESNALWEGIANDAKRRHQENQLSVVILNYLKVELAKRIIRTNEFMKTVFNSGDAVGSRFIQEILDKSRKEFSRWERFLKRTENLLTFTGQSFHQTNESKEYKDLKKFKDSLKSNISYLSVYPNMMMLVYYMKKTKSNLTIHTWFGTYTIDPNVIISALLDARLQPWFNFGNEKAALGTAEVLMASYYLVSTDLFQTYSSLKGKKTNEEVSVDFSKLDFYQTMLNGYIATTKNKIREFRNEIKSKINNKAEFSLLDNLCKKQGSNAYSAKLSISFEKIEERVFVGGGDSGPLGEAIDELNIFEVGKINTFRENLRQKLNVIKIMVNSLTEQQVQLPEDLVIKKEIEKSIAEIEKLRREVASEFINTFVSRADCFQKLENIERQRQEELILEEAEYLKKVYRYMSDLRKNPGAVAPSNLFAYLDGDIPGGQGVKGRPVIGTITENRFEYSVYDSLLRMRWRLESKGWVDVTMPTEAYIRSQEYYSKREFHSINWTENEGQFVRDALKVYSGEGNNSYVEWMGKSGVNSYGYQIAYRKLLFEAYIEGGLIDPSILGGVDENYFLLKEIVKNEIAIWNKFNIAKDSVREKALELVGKVSLYPINKIKEKVLVGSQDQKFFMDDFYALFKSSTNEEESTRLPLVQAKKFYRNMTERLHLIYPLSQKFTCESVSVYEEQMSERVGKRKLAENFLNKYVNKQLLSDNNVSKIRVILGEGNDDLNINFESETGVNAISRNMILVEENYLKDVNAVKSDFNKRYAQDCGKVK